MKLRSRALLLISPRHIIAAVIITYLAPGLYLDATPWQASIFSMLKIDLNLMNADALDIVCPY